MTWVVFHERFLMDLRPRRAIAYDIQPSPEPKNMPRNVAQRAVEEGKATKVKPPERTNNF